MKIVIGAAAGNIGSRTARKVAEANHEVVLLGRNLGNLKKLGIENAAAFEVNLQNTDEVVAHTRGADALLWLVPPNLDVPSLKQWYAEFAAAGAAVIRENNISRVVVISSIGAGAADNLGTITYAGDLEKAFRAVAKNVVFLRPGYFMENFLLQKDSILEKGVFEFPYSQEHDIPFISTDDIGDVAAAYLIDDTWAGQWSRHLLGPRNMTLTEVADLFSVELGKPVQHEQVTYDAIQSQFAQYGANENVQQELVDLYKALGDPNGVYAMPRTEEVNTPTTLQSMIRNKFLSGSRK
ncbi:NAD(P)H-binding protein [Rufibacter sediminis]|uniref:NAD(P)H-binding protein n=1 Tax=Rufibacter sediminis TaxID=2762756 RepID=A0ABR6VMS8_9BACT|nr:NAD(P)H-binding protein [Rufibacter sediminis]MBC3538488.1 NAD(P)H-binding protein [Rufibacter sediminis]